MIDMFQFPLKLPNNIQFPNGHLSWELDIYCPMIEFDRERPFNFSKASAHFTESTENFEYIFAQSFTENDAKL